MNPAKPFVEIVPAWKQRELARIERDQKRRRTATAGENDGLNEAGELEQANGESQYAIAQRERYQRATEAVLGGLSDFYDGLPDSDRAMVDLRKPYAAIRALAESGAHVAFAGDKQSAAWFNAIMRVVASPPRESAAVGGGAAVTVQLSESAAAAVAEILRALAEKR